jgi:hypothetical protein
MELDDFISSLSQKEPVKSISIELQSLWLDKNGRWDKAHELIQWLPRENFARIHAYLHRKEGDLRNANYWYSRSGEKMPEISLDEEWEYLAKKFCD